MALWLTRHGSTSWNAETPGAERLRGWHDVPLATPGLIIAKAAARFLQPVGISKLYTSDLSRASNTARIMSVPLALSVNTTRGLRPWNLGDYAGQEIAAVKPRLESLTNGKRSESTPNGESFNDFLTRWTTELKRLLAEAEYADIAAVTHARNLYALAEILFNEPIPVKGPPSPGSVTRLSGPFGRVSAETVFPGDQGKDGAS